MAIQMRRGQEVNFDADKMLPGEWAVSLDTRYVRMCFAPGVCVRMATYDAFEMDMARIEAILAECQTIEEVVTRINTEVSTNAQAVAEYTSQAKQYRDEAEEFRNQAEEIVGFGKATKDDLGIIRGGDNYIDENGTLVLTKTTTERELVESQNGGIRIISMDGESQQNGTPTPEVEVPIDSVEISEIGSHGKNFYDNVKKFASASHSGITISRGTDDTFNASGTAQTAINVVQYPFSLPVGKYILSRRTAIGGLFTLLYNQTQKKFLVSSTSANEVFFEITDENDVLDIRLQCPNGTTLNVTGQAIMIRKADVEDTTYEPYTETREELSAQITLRGKGDVKDVLCKMNGVFGVLRRLPQLVFTTIRSVLNDTNTIRYFIDLPDYAVGSNGGSDLLCNALPVKNIYSLDEAGVIVVSTNKVLTIRLPKSVLADETQATFLKYLQDNVVLFYSATPTFEPLPLADQISLHKLESFGGVTYLFTDSTIEPIVEVEYGTSKVGGYAIKALNNSEISLLKQEQLEQLTNELATQIVAGSEG